MKLQEMLRPWPTLRQPLLRFQCLHTVPPRLRPLANFIPAGAEATTNDESLDVQIRSKQPAEQNNAILRTYKPRTPGLRHLKRPINDHLYPGRVYLPLTFARKGQHLGGRNSHTGRITVRHRGGGAKRRIRIVDFHRMEPGKHLVERIEHDPGRSAHIALLSKSTGPRKSYSYIIAPQGMRAGEEVESFRSGIPEHLIRELGGRPDAGLLAAKTCFRGNCLPLHMIPQGTVVFNIGLYKGKGAQLCRSAGTYGTVLSPPEGKPKRAHYVEVKLKSGEVRRIHEECCATIGVASNVNFNRRSLGKAGRKRWLGIRPTVRGVAMNAVDHPHGGGRGKSKGNVHPVSIWGQLVSLLPAKFCIAFLSLTEFYRPKVDTRHAQNQTSIAM